LNLVSSTDLVLRVLCPSSLLELLLPSLCSLGHALALLFLFPFIVPELRDLSEVNGTVLLFNKPAFRKRGAIFGGAGDRFACPKKKKMKKITV
jgi:hypothetical protein